MSDLQQYFDSLGLSDTDYAQKSAALDKLMADMPASGLAPDIDQNPAFVLATVLHNKIAYIVDSTAITPYTLTLYTSTMTLAALTSLWADPVWQRKANSERAAQGGFDFLLQGIGGHIDDALPHGTIKIVSKMLDQEWIVTS